MKTYKKSPIVYQGSKHKLLKTIEPLFPEDINTFVDLFGGSGVVSLNVESKHTIYNELNSDITGMIWSIYNYREKSINYIQRQITTFNLKKCKVGEEGFEEFYKNYDKFREHANQNRHPLDFYTCHLFAINGMIRFNNSGGYNASFGAVSGRGIETAIEIINDLPNKDIEFQTRDFQELLNDTELKQGDFVYCDPPYLNTGATYNKGWNIDDDYRLFDSLNKLNEKGVKFGFSNTLVGKDGTKNDHIEKWAVENGYKIIFINKKYSIFGNNNTKNVEVYITNYEKKELEIIFDF